MVGVSLVSMPSGINPSIIIINTFGTFAGFGVVVVVVVIVPVSDVDVVPVSEVVVVVVVSGSVSTAALLQAARAREMKSVG
jgi:hypothetical protein